MVTVYLVEDSPLIRSQLTSALSASGQIRVVGATDDPFVAWEQIIRQPVDVLLLDTGLKRFNSLTFFRYLLDSCPVPTVLLSPLSGIGNQMAIEALRYGAVAVWIKKPASNGSFETIDDLVSQIVTSARIERERLDGQKDSVYLPAIPQLNSHSADACRDEPVRHLIAVGGSTGAVAAMQVLFSGFTVDFPPSVAVIHLPEGFTATYAQHLNDACEVTVKEAEDGEIPQNGFVYLAPGNRHLMIERRRSGFALRVIGGPKVFFQRPAADVLFHSVADVLGKEALGVLLTGMGKDGAEGLLRMRQAGSHTITQDEASCVVYGMPKEAVNIGASCQALPIDRIADELRSRVC